MSLTAQNLGQVAAIYIGTTPPTNITLIWYNTSVGVNSQFIYDTVTSTWVDLGISYASDAEVSAGTVNNKAISPLTLKNWWNTTNGEVKSNKVTSILGNETNVNQYPNNKALADYISYFYTNGVIPAIEGHIVDLASFPNSSYAPSCASVTTAIRNVGRICPKDVNVQTSSYTAGPFENIIGNIHTAGENVTINIPISGEYTPSYGDVIYVRCGIPGTSPSPYTTIITGGISITLNQDEWILIRFNGYIWEIITTNINTNNIGVENGLTLVDNVIKLGGVLTDVNTIISVNGPNKNFFIGESVNGQDLQFISLSSTVFNLINVIDHNTVQGNIFYITPGGLNSINQFQSGVQTVLNANPEAVVMKYGNNKLINLYIFGGGIIPAGGETLTINDITFTEGIDFIGEGNYVLDTTNILNTLNWNSIPNFVSVTQKTDSFNEPYLEVIFSEIAVATTTISNLSISNFANENKMLVDKDGVLLKSRNNEITLTNDSTNINSNNVSVLQSENGVIKNSVWFSRYGSFLRNVDGTDSSISSSNVVGNFGSVISNFNNRKIGLSIVGEILSGESFTVNGITFTEGVDFTTVNDPNLDALAISEIDYSSVPNLVSVSSVNDFVTFVFNTIDNTIVSNITNSYVANYLFTTSVFAGKDFALMQSNNSGLQIGDTGHIFADNTIEKQGIRYAGDYSATYTDRSLVDKGYVDTKASKATVLRNGSTSSTVAATLITVNDEGIVTATDVANSTLITNSSGLSGITISDTLNWLKDYTDSNIAGLKFKLDCAAASTANVNISSAPSTLDGVTLISGVDRILLKNQTTASENGCYLFNGAGLALTRTTDADIGEELISATFPIKGGTTNQDTWFTCTNDSIIIGTTSIIFTQTGGTGTYTNGAGLTLTGNIFSIATGAITNSMLAGSIDLPTKVTGILSPGNGGTGVANNPAYTITLGGGVVTSNNVIIGSSNHTVVLATTGATSVTLPTSGTLYGTAASSISSAQLLASLSDETGTGVVVFNNSPTLTTPNISSIKGTLTAGTDGATITFNKNTSDFHNVVMAGNRTLALSNMAAGDRIVIRLVQDAIGSRIPTWFTTIKWAGGVAPTLTTTPNKADVFGFLCTSAGNYDGFIIGQNI